MDELPISCVDPHVAQAVEEDQIARLQLTATDVATLVVLGSRVVGQADARLGVGVHDQARAVEGARTGCAVHVRLAEFALGYRQGGQSRRAA